MTPGDCVDWDIMEMSTLYDSILVTQEVIVDICVAKESKRWREGFERIVVFDLCGLTESAKC